MTLFRLLLLAALLSGCTPVVQTVYLQTELTRPPRPVLAKVKAAELECLSDSVYQRLFDRQNAITEYAILLEAIIDSTKTDVKK